MVKTYVLMLSKVFPSYHPRCGQLTHFAEKLQFAKDPDYGYRCTDIAITEGKPHTIRLNYELWFKRAVQINSGQAVLSIRQWAGKPYRSKQKEIMVLNKIEVQKIEFNKFLGLFIDNCDSDVTIDVLAKNDGLSKEDFVQWFKKIKYDTPMALIHFTDFKY